MYHALPLIMGVLWLSARLPGEGTDSDKRGGDADEMELRTETVWSGFV
jgi:hypothetical protein